MAHHPSSANQNSIGIGLLGCLGGILLGLGGGAFLVGLASWVIAVNQPMPPRSITPTGQPDLRVTVTEDFLNRYAEQPVDGAMTLDILPQNQLQVNTSSMVEVLGATMSVQATGLFVVETTGLALQIRLLQTKVFGLELDMSHAFDQDIATVNQNLQELVDEISMTMGAPVIVTAVSSDDRHLRLDFREAQ